MEKMSFVWLISEALHKRMEAVALSLEATSSSEEASLGVALWGAV